VKDNGGVSFFSFVACVICGKWKRGGEGEVDVCLKYMVSMKARHCDQKKLGDGGGWRLFG
jgi:hypothetical protein